jgi:hypothetical protein
MRLRSREGQPYIYLSGSGSMFKTDEADRKWLRRTGCKYRCYSFAYTCPDAFYYTKKMHRSLDVSVTDGVGVMMDSGAHSFHNWANTAGKSIRSKKKSFTSVDELRDQTVELYAEYCHEHLKEWDFYITFDYRIHAPTVFKMTELLEKKGLRPVPVFHGDDGMDWFRRYVDKGYKLISVGLGGRKGWRRQQHYFDELFNEAAKNNIRLHGLAVTSFTGMFKYPWYSVDSATWVKVGAYGKIITVDPVNRLIGQVHVTDHLADQPDMYVKMPRQVQRALRDKVEGHGFDFDKVRHSLAERCTYNAYIYCQEIPRVLKDTDIVKVSENIRWRSLL